MSANSGPGYASHPNHRIVTGRAAGRVRVTFNGEVIADTRYAVKLEESNHATVYYVPRQDVKMDYLTRTEHRSHCPFKGDASYYTLSSGQRSEPNAVWSYEQPYDEVQAIRGLLAFYPTKVDRIETQPD